VLFIRNEPSHIVLCSPRNVQNFCLSVYTNFKLNDPHDNRNHYNIYLINLTNRQSAFVPRHLSNIFPYCHLIHFLSILDGWVHVHLIFRWWYFKVTKYIILFSNIIIKRLLYILLYKTEYICSSTQLEKSYWTSLSSCVFVHIYSRTLRVKYIITYMYYFFKMFMHTLKY